MELQETISAIVQWAVVPVITLGLLWYAAGVVPEDAQADRKMSARAGFWAGVVLFVIYLVSQLQAVKEPTFKFSALPQIDLQSMGIGFVVGFLFLWLVRFLAPTRMVGLITLTLSSSSMAALYSYFFIDSLRTELLYIALGIALGVLCHIIFFPGSVRRN